MVEEVGYPFSGGGEPPEADVARIRERLPLASSAEGSVLANRDLFGRLATDAMLPSTRAVMAEWRPDLVLREPCEYASAIVAQEMTIKTAQVAISSARSELASIAAARPALEVHRAGLVRELVTAPYVTRFPSSIDPSEFATTVRYRTETLEPRPLPDWWHGSDAPLIYVTFGTVLGYMSIAPAVVNTVMKAVSGFPDARVLLTIGRQLDPSSIAPLPANVRLESWVAQADVLAQADVVLCHGGSGTVFGALAAGVPVVVVPVFADQFDNGRRISERGAGVTIEPARGSAESPPPVIGEDDVDRIGQAVGMVLADPGFRDQAAGVAAEMATATSVGEVLAALQADDPAGPLSGDGVAPMG
jgi:UDP:flavonoid glycosyltransferase YjiC (YdhE family)